MTYTTDPSGEAVVGPTQGSGPSTPLSVTLSEVRHSKRPSKSPATTLPLRPCQRQCMMRVQ
jgi:hypothetical protein